MERGSAIALLLLACELPPVQLAVDLRTDLVPEIEFAYVRTEAASAGLEVTVPVRPDAAFIDGERVAELGLARGSHRISLTLLDAAGDAVAVREVVVQLDDTTAVTVLVSRACAGVRCPAGESCFGAQCVDPRCLSGAEEHCPPAQCAAPEECAPAAAECASARCISGQCLVELDPSRCAAGELCQPACGCIPEPPRAGDGGAPDPARYCGTCGADCTALAGVAEASCADGACAVVRCGAGLGDCDGDPSNGCEATLGWTPGGGDHCGTDWILSDGEVVAGEHTRVGRFEVPPGVTVTIAPFDGTAGGTLSVEAREIVVHGTLDANGAGHLGGTGGRGAASGAPYCGGDGGPGALGGGPQGGAAGAPGRGNGNDRDTDPGCRYANGTGGGAGALGGYAAPRINGDSSTGDDVHMGSGGGGGGGGGAGSRFGSNNNYPAGTGGGGGAGGRGGGAIRLIAQGDLVLSGLVRARGTLAGDGQPGVVLSSCDRYDNPRGGAGGSPSAAGTSGAGARRCQPACTGTSGASNTCGGDGGTGGAGSGGGVLLSGRSILATGGRVRVQGARTEDPNGGTLKLRFECAHEPGTYETGRLHEASRGPCE